MGDALYGVFHMVELSPLSLDQAIDMLSRLATASGDEMLATFLRSPAARPRLAAIGSLTGGLPRMWSLLASGLSAEGLDELVDVVLTRIDDLTPYFQSRVSALSPQEAKVVRALADAPGPLNVRQVAARSGIEAKAAARALVGLRRSGWVHSRASARSWSAVMPVAPTTT